MRPVRAQGLELTQLEVHRGEDAVTLTYAVQLELAKPVEEALLKGVPLHFTAEAALYKQRWYWRDRQLGGPFAVGAWPTCP